jgi:hypothetical protein
MGFASAYLEERAIFPELIKEAPDKDTAIIVVVPAYDEPGITKMLDSLALCSVPSCRTEVVIVVNAPADASAESIKNNNLVLENIERWKAENHDSFFRLYSVEIRPGHLKEWGVGLARKTGMDEAIRRFSSIGRPDGVILNLDADCLVEMNYFVSVYDELHLRYYFQGLKYTGFPYVFHTVGSAIGVRALSYIKAGGMNRKRAGEDFYFIQKLVPSGGYFSLNSTTVYPSPRPSFRVPFGTGASVGKMTGSGEAFLLTYNILAFNELKSFFCRADEYYSGEHHKFSDFYNSLPQGLKSFISEEELSEKLMEIKNNTSDFPAFKKRFFGWFNMFRVVKYLNHVHSAIYEKKSVPAAASELLIEQGLLEMPQDPVRLLSIYRSIEKGS